MTDIVERSGFPPGYFVVRSAACERLLDVSGDEIEDGTEIVLWPEKEKSLVETFRDSGANNQVFFLDASGALCSRSSGHAIDVEGGKLVLRHRRPISYPYPNKYAHPLPRFTYSASTGEIEVHFEYDPAFPAQTGAPSQSPSTTTETWRTKRYLLVSVPMRKPPPIALLSGQQQQPLRHSKPDEVFDGRIELNEEDIIDEERGEEGEVDDSGEMLRQVRVIAVDRNEGKRKVSERARKRRTWNVYPLRKSNARTGGL
ncbi:hypothetical protein CC1G_13737 [Coprinopsis cinerea okayama7|uniref:Uncharacterized protein n=1 Tax=Coprinopsis cinerea (strain Okayama-7 / 130 / ATCC MYA-4618 / FGSC 9003) TaxID=240176 RepID=D6RJR0_COPC7|nr:hypothetical protein CC1G_13737 [Coprinopsis cinerea okayama7\|eukprot:XP_002912205.1 hypothetical protein CC1G_13737 [Coprinopsis cinerea okayama7\